MLLLKCLGPQEDEYTLAEVHSGTSSEHLKARALATKVLRAIFSSPRYNKTLLRKV